MRFLAIVVALLGCREAPAKAVPFELLANAVFVEARVNGHGPFVLALDTGSCCSIFASELVGELGLVPTGTSHGVGAGSSATELGVIRGRIAFELANGVVLATDDANTVSMAALWPLIGKKFYGAIGYDVLAHSTIRIDYDHRNVTIGGELAPPVLAATLAMGYDPQLPGAIAVGSDRFATRVTIDTGAGGTVVTSPIVARHRLLDHARTLPRPSNGVGGGHSDDVVARIDALAIGPFVIPAPIVALSTDTGGSLASDALGINLGGNVLRRFVVTIDYPRKLVTLEPGADFTSPAVADASGLVLRADGDDFRRFVVTAVVAGSPADDAQLHAGDAIAAIDGTTSLALWQLQARLEHAGTRVALTIVRDGATFDRDLALRPLL
jgi:PDZ domain/Aspartyl protease